MTDWGGGAGPSQSNSARLRQRCAVAKRHPTLSSSGDDLLSRFVNLLIATPPLYAVMKVAAKAVLKNSAESAGVAWDGTARGLQACEELYEIKDELERKDMLYPSYYEQPFHAYEKVRRKRKERERGRGEGCGEGRGAVRWLFV